MSQSESDPELVIDVGQHEQPESELRVDSCKDDASMYACLFFWVIVVVLAGPVLFGVAVKHYAMRTDMATWPVATCDAVDLVAGARNSASTSLVFSTVCSFKPGNKSFPAGGNAPLKGWFREPEIYDNTKREISTPGWIGFVREVSPDNYRVVSDAQLERNDLLIWVILSGGMTCFVAAAIGLMVYAQVRYLCEWNLDEDEKREKRDMERERRFAEMHVMVAQINNSGQVAATGTILTDAERVEAQAASANADLTLPSIN